MAETTTSLFPVAYGTEEEKGILTDAGFAMDEPYDLIKRLYEFLPDTIQGRGAFLKNGFKIYAGGASQASQQTNLEIATPECATPSELLRYSRASDLIMRSILNNYVAQTSDDLGRPVTARSHHRVVDSHENRKACHDNFATSANKKTVNKLLDHLSSRSIVTGAGVVSRGHFEFAQKIGGLSEVKGYGYHGSMYRKSDSEGTPRLEVRCSDVNISDWATWQRVGGVALTIAISRSELSKKLKAMHVHPDTITRASLINILPLSPEGEIKATHDIMQALDFQQQLADLAMQLTEQTFDETSDEYFRIAAELYRYCDDLRDVLNGTQDLEILADRADWATKLSLIRRRRQKDRDFGITGHVHDINAMATDLRYDLYSVTGTDGKVTSSSEGTGYKLRHKGSLTNRVSDLQAIRATQEAPRSTRAHLRADLLKHYFVASADWNRVVIQDADDHRATIHLDDVTQIAFSDHDKARIESVSEFRNLGSIR